MALSKTELLAELDRLKPIYGGYPGMASRVRTEINRGRYGKAAKRMIDTLQWKIMLPPFERWVDLYEDLMEAEGG